MWLRLTLLLLLLVLLTQTAPPPWGVLWLAVPAAVTVSLLAAWRFGRWSVLLPVAFLAAGLGLGGAERMWVWWVPAGALSGVWMGLREETGPLSGDRAWAMLPVLVLAAALPWASRYAEFVQRFDQVSRLADEQTLRWVRQMSDGARLESMERSVRDAGESYRKMLPNLVPTGIFLWVAVLVAAGRSLSARVSSVLRWPALSRARLQDWRLPDGALWLFLAGIALLLAGWKGWMPTGWTLVLNAGLGFCVQGIAVVESLLLARGVPAAIIYPTLLFLFLATLPYFVLCAGALGLSDVWLDYRRLEGAAEDEQP